MSEPHLDLDRLAHLARIKLSDEEKERFRPQLEAIVGYFEQLSRLPLDEATPDQPLSVGSRLGQARQEQVGDCLSPADALRNTADQAAGKFRVPQMIDV